MMDFSGFQICSGAAFWGWCYGEKKTGLAARGRVAGVFILCNFWEYLGSFWGQSWTHGESGHFSRFFVFYSDVSSYFL
jgi:hypothetical protein